MDQSKNKTYKADGAQNGAPEDNGVGKMIWVAVGGLIVAFILAQVLNREPEAWPEAGAGNDLVGGVQAEKPYVEPAGDGTTHSNMKPGFQHPKAKILNAEGEVVPANPAIAEQMRQERELAEKRRAALRASRGQARPTPPPGLRDQIPAPPGGWPEKQIGKAVDSVAAGEGPQLDYVVAAFEEMRASGELAEVLEAQNRTLQEDLAENPDEPGTGLTQQELDEIRDNQYLILR